MKITAQMTTAENGRSYYALMVDGKPILKQTAAKLEQSVDELDSLTVTFVGKVDANGAMQICEI